jgi:hypothetical protein
MANTKVIEFYKGIPIYTTESEAFLVSYSPGNNIPYLSIEDARRSIDGYKDAITQQEKRYAQ